MFEMDPDLVIDQVDKSGIRGRGGGGFRQVRNGFR